MKIIILVLFAFLALACAKNSHSKDEEMEMDFEIEENESRKLSGGRFAAPNRTKQVHAPKREKITDISECPWMASVRDADCPRSTYGFNAVYVAASWVLTNDFIVKVLTDSGAKKKSIVVVSETKNIPWGTDGVVRRVKDIVFEWGFSIALLKVSGEQHGFIELVPPSWQPDTTTLHTIYFWEDYSEDIEYIDEVLLAVQTACPNASPNNVCLEQIPLWVHHDIWGAVLVDDENRLVGMIYDVSDGETGYYEYADSAAAMYPWIRSTIKSKDAGNYDNAK